LSLGDYNGYDIKKHLETGSVPEHV